MLKLGLARTGAVSAGGADVGGRTVSEEHQQLPVRWSDFRASTRWWPVYSIEWLFERLDSHLRRLAILSVLARLTVAAALLTYIAECGDRQQARHNQAWIVIETAHESSSDGGRAAAAEGLAKDGVSLAGLGIPGAHLESLSLPHASLMDADFESTTIAKADFRDSDLSEAHFSFAKLGRADFRGARMHLTNFTRVSIGSANFSGGRLFRANLTESVFNEADFAGADLTGANLRGADLRGSRGLTRDQIEAACTGPSKTRRLSRLPVDLDRVQGSHCEYWDGG